MRVSFFHYLYETPGPLAQVSEFREAFQSLGHEIFLHSMARGPQEVFGDRAKETLKPYLGKYFHELNSLRKNWSYSCEVDRIIKSVRPDVVLTRYQLYYGSSVAAAQRHGVPSILWVHSPAAYEQRKYVKKYFQIPRLAEWSEEKTLQKADKLIFVSEELKEFFPKEIAENGKVEVIPNGVDPEKFSPSLDGGNLRTRFPLSHPVILGFVGSFSPWHGIEGLKLWMNHVLTRFENTCFLLVGDGPRRKDLEEFVRRGGWDPRRVWFTGQIEHAQVPHYTAAMDICLLPYDQGSEGFYFSPLKLFEYLASGKPVLSARIGQIERIVEDGVNGFLYPSENPSEAFPKLDLLIENPALRQKLGASARETVLQKYTWLHTAKAVERIFLEALEGEKEKCHA